jgi:hypothetical protein
VVESGVHFMGKSGAVFLSIWTLIGAKSSTGAPILVFPSFVWFEWRFYGLLPNLLQMHFHCTEKCFDVAQLLTCDYSVFSIYVEPEKLQCRHSSSLFLSQPNFF